MRVGVYASARDEERNVSDWLDTVDDADVVVVNDTGSSDDTFALLDKAGCRVTQRPVVPMQLSHALNIAMEHLPEDVDVAVRLDFDERLQPGWRDTIEAHDWSTPHSGQVWFDHRGCVYRLDRAHSRHGFHWTLPVHELLEAVDGPTLRLPLDLTIEHHQDATKDRSQVLGELRAAVAAEPDNLRMLHYLGRELMYERQYREAIDVLWRHATSDAFAEERSESWRYLGDCLTFSQPWMFVSDIPYKEAIDACPTRREGYVSLAILYHEQGRPYDARALAVRALSITERSWYFNHPYAWDDDMLRTL